MGASRKNKRESMMILIVVLYFTIGMGIAYKMVALDTHEYDMLEWFNVIILVLCWWIIPIGAIVSLILRNLKR